MYYTYIGHTSLLTGMYYLPSQREYSIFLHVVLSSPHDLMCPTESNAKALHLHGYNYKLRVPSPRWRSSIHLQL